MMRFLALVSFMAALAGIATPAAAQHDRDRLREELIHRLDQKLRRLRAELVREIDRRLGRASRPAARPFVGIALKPISQGIRVVLGIPEGEGVLVEGVADNSPAEKAGLLTHDIILKVDGAAVRGVEDLIARISRSGVGSRMAIEGIRRGRPIRITVTIGAASARPDDERPAPRRRGLERSLERALRPGQGHGRDPLRRMFGGGQNWGKMMEQAQKMMRRFFGPDADPNSKKMFRDIMRNAQRMFQRFMKDPASRKRMEEMMKKMFGGKGFDPRNLRKMMEGFRGGPDGKGFDLRKMMERFGRRARPSRKPLDQEDARKVNRMLDRLLKGYKPGQKEPVKKSAPDAAGFLGVSLAPVSPAVRTATGLKEGEGILVQGVLDKGPAALAGIQRHDILLSIAGKKTGSVADLKEALAGRTAGQGVSVTLLRMGRRLTLEVTLGTAPAIRKFG